MKHIGFMYPCMRNTGWHVRGKGFFFVLPASPTTASEDRSRNSDVQAWLRPFHTDLVLWFSSCQSYLTFHELQNLLCLLKQDVVVFFFVEFLKRDSWAVCACVCVLVLWLWWALIRSKTEGSFYYNLISRRERHTVEVILQSEYESLRLIISYSSRSIVGLKDWRGSQHFFFQDFTMVLRKGMYLCRHRVKAQTNLLLSFHSHSHSLFHHIWRLGLNSQGTNVR